MYFIKSHGTLTSYFVSKFGMQKPSESHDQHCRVSKFQKDAFKITVTDGVQVKNPDLIM